MIISPTELALIRHLEEELLRPEIRRSADQVSRLLADEFIEFGSSGAIYDKCRIIEALQQEAPSTAVRGRLHRQANRVRCRPCNLSKYSGGHTQIAFAKFDLEIYRRSVENDLSSGHASRDFIARANNLALRGRACRRAVRYRLWPAGTGLPRSESSTFSAQAADGNSCTVNERFAYFPYGLAWDWTRKCRSWCSSLLQRWFLRSCSRSGRSERADDDYGNKTQAGSRHRALLGLPNAPRTAGSPLR